MGVDISNIKVAMIICWTVLYPFQDYVGHTVHYQVLSTLYSCAIQPICILALTKIQWVEDSMQIFHIRMHTTIAMELKWADTDMNSIDASIG